MDQFLGGRSSDHIANRHFLNTRKYKHLHNSVKKINGEIVIITTHFLSYRTFYPFLIETETYPKYSREVHMVS